MNGDDNNYHVLYVSLSRKEMKHCEGKDRKQVGEETGVGGETERLVNCGKLLDENFDKMNNCIRMCWRYKHWL